MPKSNSSNAAKRFSYLSLALLFTSSSFASDGPKYQVGLTYEIPVAGKLNIDEDPLIGLEGKYFLSHNGPHHIFAGGGFKTDTDKSGFATDLLFVDIGGQYDFTDSVNHRGYWEYSFGATYLQEEFSVDLLDREVNESFSEFGYKASFGVGYEFSNSFNTKLSISQFGGESESRTIGLTFSFSF